VAFFSLFALPNLVKVTRRSLDATALEPDEMLMEVPHLSVCTQKRQDRRRAQTNATAHAK